MIRYGSHNYLAIPEDYCQWLGGLRWCADHEAVEHVAPPPAVGGTFAMAGEIGLFLEGYVPSAGGRLICFGFVLHLLHLLGLGFRAPSAPEGPERFLDLASALRETGRPIRNAGALCAWLCRDVPRALEPPSLSTLIMWLRWPRMFNTIYPQRVQLLAEVPPLSPAEFEARVLRALERLTPDEVRHWLRHGRGPVPGAGEAVARTLTRDFAAVLADLGERPRLAGAVPLVERLAGALALPPRRLAQAELPTGGYADIATRGLPEHLLPAQFALDDLEFLRRFASRELLYFHREEPRAPAAEELVLVLDQGVRTWGDVRLVLAASALALLRRAARQGITSRITTTAAAGKSIEPVGAEPDVLGRLLEASDLSLHPGSALGHVLDEPSERPRDVVLLTHPRCLQSPEVAAVARRATPGTRLFAIAVDGGGEVALSELRHGAPVALGRCRVVLSAPGAPEPPKAPAARTDPAPWRGDVEPIGFPFRLGLQGIIDNDRFDFDDAGDWLLAAGRPPGPLHAWRVDGTAAEMLPRAAVGGEVVSSVHQVLGVAGGFVVHGWNGKSFVVAHYDFNGRTCTAHVLDDTFKMAPWSYLRHLHTIVDRDPRGPCHALDLGVSKEEAARTHRAARACNEAHEAFPKPIGIINLKGAPPPAVLLDPKVLDPERRFRDIIDTQGRAAASRVICFDTGPGALVIRFAQEQWRTCIPRDDGQPALKGGRIVQAHAGRDVIASLVRTPRQSWIVLVNSHDEVNVQSMSLPANVTSFALSRDGRRIAYRDGHRGLKVRDVGGGPVPRFLTPLGKSHSTLDVALGNSFLTVQVGKHAHLIRWDGGRLELSRNVEGDTGKLIARAFGGGARTVRAVGRIKDAALGRRFVTECSSHGLTALVDTFGQVAVCDSERQLICMFFVFRQQVAAWMPDGTRVGPLPVIGGPATPDGPERIGAALCAAQARARGRAPIGGQHA